MNTTLPLKRIYILTNKYAKTQHVAKLEKKTLIQEILTFP